MSPKNPKDWSEHFSQLANRPGPDTGLRLDQPRYNPRPAGIIRPGSATQAVLALLQTHPARWFNHYQIVSKTGRTTKAVDWALLYLKARGMVLSSKDEWRNSRYLRYQIAKGQGPKDA